MNYPPTEFRLIDRGFKDYLALIPGWATDHRIFSTLDLNYNYLLPVRFAPFNFNSPLKNFLRKQSIDKISLFGWSMGAFLAQGFALNNQPAVNELILVGMRKKFEAQALKETKEQVIKNKKAFLCKFYLNFFSDNDKEALWWFKKNLLRDYCNKACLKELAGGLDYLAQAKIEAGTLAGFRRLRVFQGEKDRICPFEEAREIKNDLPSADFVGIPETGHAPFLNKNFRGVFYG